MTLSNEDILAVAKAAQAAKPGTAMESMCSTDTAFSPATSRMGLGESFEALGPRRVVVHDDDGSFFAAADQYGVQPRICFRFHRSHSPPRRRGRGSRRTAEKAQRAGRNV